MDFNSSLFFGDENFDITGMADPTKLLKGISITSMSLAKYILSRMQIGFQFTNGILVVIGKTFELQARINIQCLTSPFISTNLEN